MLLPHTKLYKQRIRKIIYLIKSYFPPNSRTLQPITAKPIGEIERKIQEK